VARVERWLPGLRTLREYQRSWLASDLMAGLVLTALLVPVGRSARPRPPSPTVAVRLG
jgi:MFS superfamily sulfate permease-like transporter